MLFSILAAAAIAGSPPAVQVPDQPALASSIAAADAEFFQLFFEGRCDLPRFRAFLTEDVEFYHDKGGFNVHNADEFVAIFAKNCKEREDPTTWRSRRELVQSSLHVDPIPGWGAMQTGDHLFYERHGVKGTEHLAGKAKFAMVWVLGTDGKWRISRVLSYAHGPASSALASAAK